MANPDRPQGARRAVKARRDLATGAEAQGWDLTDDADTCSAAFPEHLRARMVRPLECERMTTGPDFTARTWRCGATRGSMFGLLTTRLYVLEMPAPQVDLELFFGRMPDGRSPIVMPEVFRDRVALLPEAKVMAGGDIEKVLGELEPLLGRIADPRLSLVCWHGTVLLLSLEEPDTAALRERTELAREIVLALSPGLS